MQDERLDQILGSWVDPHGQRDWLSSGCIEHHHWDDGVLSLDVALPYPFASVAEELAAGFQEHLAAAGITSRLRLRLQVPRRKVDRGLAGLQSVKNIIAVASGKGGVGKSTTAVNLAFALAAEGARVGLLDADIYGPSLPTLLGVKAGTRPEVADEKYFRPLPRLGVEFMSMGLLVTEQTPVVWRGPMATGALMQMLTQTLWSDLDYLIVDMPPGTGDIALTLAQKVPISAGLIVTTPQDLALLDAIKALEMFRKVSIPVLGVVENMATHVCSHCGHEEAIFGSGGAQRLAQDYALERLASLPLSITLRQSADEGRNLQMPDGDADLASRYRHLARRVAIGLASAEVIAANRIPNIVFS